MIVTVTLNTAIDKTLSVPNFRLGRRHRTVEQTTMPGGKGVNVARVLKTLGAPVIATGLAGGATGTRTWSSSRRCRCCRTSSASARSRAPTRPVDPTTGEQTEINERGPKVTEREVELFVDKLYLAKGATMCVFAGSLPREVDTDIYAHLIRELRRLNVTTVVDTDGEPLRRAVRAEPDVISPNVLESEELVGHEFNDDEDRVIAVREMCELGARQALMTMPDGCFAQVMVKDSPSRCSIASGCARERSAPRHRRLRRRVPRRLRRRPLPGARKRRRAGVRRRVRRRVHAASWRGPGRPRPGRAPARRRRGREADPRASGVARRARRRAGCAAPGSPARRAGHAARATPRGRAARRARATPRRAGHAARATPRRAGRGFSVGAICPPAYGGQ